MPATRVSRSEVLSYNNAVKLKRSIKYDNFLIAVFLIVFITFALTIFKPDSAHAATLNVASGSDTISVDGNCHLSEAIQNINDQATTNSDCIAGDGNNDTINLPSGTITLTANLPEIQQSVSFEGQGMDTTVIDGVDTYSMFYDSSTVCAGENRIVEFLGMTIVNHAVQAGIFINCSDLVLNGIEIDGSSSMIDVDGVLLVGNGSTGNRVIDANNIYIHDYDVDIPIFYAFVVGNTTTGNLTTTVNIDTVTIENITSTGITNNLVIMSGNVQESNGTVNAIINNATVQNITSTGGSVNGITASSASTGGSPQTTTVSLNLNNSTVRNVSGLSGIYGPSVGVAIGGLSLVAGSVMNTDLTTTNVIVSNNTSDGFPLNCTIKDLTSDFGGMGTTNYQFNSSGGNLTDDTSCDSYFTHPTDQTNVTNLSSFLGTIGNYGGLVPTIPLLPGSPAIDSGITVAGVTTDARGVSRPQCYGYDSGAYEYDGTCPDPPSSSQVLSYPESKTKTTAYLILNQTVTNPTVSERKFSDLPQDSNLDYPANLTDFSLNTTPGATETVTLYYQLSGNPSDYTARKYNTNTKQYSYIQGASITREDYNNTSMLKLTYQITDGGPLDQDNQANGIIVDPVGLATTKSSGSLVNTGSLTILSTLLGSIIIAIVAYTYIDYRRFKKPLMIAEPNIAKQYTYWHHLKVVRLPIAKYRVMVVFERRG